MTTTTAAPARDHISGPALPRSRGELSRTVRQALTRPAGTPLPQRVTAAYADPYGDDLQLALHLCYELHYRGFAGVDPAWEWDPELLRLRAELEHRFLSALRADVGPPRSADEALADLLVEPVDERADEPADPEGPSPFLSQFLKEQGELWQFRE